MSRIGKQPIEIPNGVEIKLQDNLIMVKGAKGRLQQLKSEFVNLDIQKDVCLVTRIDDTKRSKSEHGLMRSLINNMIVGVTEGFEKRLELIGIGYRVKQEGSNLVFNIGFSHDVNFTIPDGIVAQIEGNNIRISGINKQQVGQIAASIRQLKKPEPYKGKGIRYKDEIVKRKAGKGAKT